MMSRKEEPTANAVTVSSTRSISDVDWTKYFHFSVTILYIMRTTTVVLTACVKQERSRVFKICTASESLFASLSDRSLLKPMQPMRLLHV